MEGSQFTCEGENVLGRPSRAGENQCAGAVVGRVDQTQVQRRLPIVLVPSRCVDLQAETDRRVEIRGHLILVAGRQLILFGAEVRRMNDDGLLSTIGKPEQELCKRISGVVDPGKLVSLPLKANRPEGLRGRKLFTCPRLA